MIDTAQAITLYYIGNGADVDVRTRSALSAAGRNVFGILELDVAASLATRHSDIIVIVNTQPFGAINNREYHLLDRAERIVSEKSAVIRQLYARYVGEHPGLAVMAVGYWIIPTVNEGSPDELVRLAAILTRERSLEESPIIRPHQYGDSFPQALDARVLRLATAMASRGTSRAPRTPALGASAYSGRA